MSPDLLTDLSESPKLREPNDSREPRDRFTDEYAAIHQSLLADFSPALPIGTTINATKEPEESNSPFGLVRAFAVGSLAGSWRPRRSKRTSDMHEP